jgi:rhodanese-related sulfurtransferase
VPSATIPPFQEASPEEAAELLARGALALDVRTEREHEESGHLPGSLLLPLPLVSSGPAVLPEDGRPVIVYCDNGIRSRRAAAYLGDAGVHGVHHLRGGLAAWSGERVRGVTPVSGPAPWLVSHVGLAPRGARTLDVACGRGRHALLLAGAGYPVRAVDRDPDRIAALRASALKLRLPLEAEVVDLESGAVSLGDGEWELVLVFRYLHRPLFPALVRALRPRGLLVYETFTTGHARHGGPTNPDFLLEPGELPRLVAPLEVIRQREGVFDGEHVASVVARRSAAADEPRRRP